MAAEILKMLHPKVGSVTDPAEQFPDIPKLIENCFHSPSNLQYIITIKIVILKDNIKR